MSNCEVESRYTLACQIAEDAGELAMDYYRKRHSLQIESKGLQDIVSQADFAVENFIRQKLHARFPKDFFLGEETAASDFAAIKQGKENQVIWVVDPIDGTYCFLNGIAAWSISIACLINREIAVGVIIDPNVNEIYASMNGKGATLNGIPIHVRANASITDGCVGVGFSHRIKPDATLKFMNRLLSSGGVFLRNGSGALSLAYVAAGRMIGFYEPHINSWDCLAGILLIQEAGGWTNDFLANNGLEEGNPILAGTPAIKAELLEFADL